jgi:hypothetical protein
MLRLFSATAMSALGHKRTMQCKTSCPLTPNSDPESRLPLTVISALHPKADLFLRCYAVPRIARAAKMSMQAPMKPAIK